MPGRHHRLCCGWVERAFQSPDPRFRQYSQRMWQVHCEGFARLHNSTSTEQRQRLAQTLQRYENDFRALLVP